VNEREREGFRRLHPQGWPPVRGYAHGVLADGHVFVAGQVGLATPRLPSLVEELAAQFGRALDNVVAVVESAGGRADDIVELRIFVTDLDAYRAARPSLREGWRRLFGRAEPAVTLVEVKGLVDEGAMVEIAGRAIVSPKRAGETDGR